MRAAPELVEQPAASGQPAPDVAEARANAGGRDEPRLQRLRRNAGYLVRSHPLGFAGLLVIVFVTLFCFVGPLVYRTNQVGSNLALVNLPPGASHPLGTDATGFDVLGRLMVGGQSSIEIGFAVAILATALGVVWGAIAGFVGGPIDAVMMRVVDTIMAIPILFFLLILASSAPPDTLELILVLSLLSWQIPSRLIRGESLSLRTREYVQAVRVMGGGPSRSVLRHIIPNAVGTIVVNATFQVATAILILATLSYLGFGLPPPAATWGGMLSNGTNFIFSGYWWEIYPVGVLIVLVVVAFNLVGDALRSVLDARLRSR